VVQDVDVNACVYSLRGFRARDSFVDLQSTLMALVDFHCVRRRTVVHQNPTIVGARPKYHFSNINSELKCLSRWSFEWLYSLTCTLFFQNDVLGESSYMASCAWPRQLGREGGVHAQHDPIVTSVVLTRGESLKTFCACSSPKSTAFKNARAKLIVKFPPYGVNPPDVCAGITALRSVQKKACNPPPAGFTGVWSCIGHRCPCLFYLS